MNTTTDKLLRLKYSDVVKILGLPKIQNPRNLANWDNDRHSNDAAIHTAGYQKCSWCQRYAHEDFMNRFLSFNGHFMGLICDNDREFRFGNDIISSSCRDRVKYLINDRNLIRYPGAKVKPF